jgi:hypothetical protein
VFEATPDADEARPEAVGKLLFDCIRQGSLISPTLDK